MDAGLKPGEMGFDVNGFTEKDFIHLSASLHITGSLQSVQASE